MPAPRPLIHPEITLLLRRPRQRRPQLIENSELSPQFDSIHSSFVVALQEEESRIAQADEAAVQADDEDIDEDQVVQQASGGACVCAQQSDVLQVPRCFADVEQRDDGFLQEEEG